MNLLIPEIIIEAFSVGVDSYEDEDVSDGEGYLNAVFLDGVTISPLTSKAVSGFIHYTYINLLKI